MFENEIVEEIHRISLLIYQGIKSQSAYNRENHPCFGHSWSIINYVLIAEIIIAKTIEIAKIGN